VKDQLSKDVLKLQTELEKTAAKLTTAEKEKVLLEQTNDELLQRLRVSDSTEGIS
jgi:hypothetical protein